MSLPEEPLMSLPEEEGYGATLATQAPMQAHGWFAPQEPPSWYDAALMPAARPPAPAAPAQQAAPQAPAAPAGPQPLDQMHSEYQELQRRLLEQRLQQQLQGSAGVRVDPQWVPRGVQMQAREALSEPTVQALEESTRARADAEVAVARAEQAAGERLALQSEQEAAAAQTELDEDRARRVEIDRRVSALLDEQDREVQQASETRIDPRRWWTDKSAGGKIAAIIGAVLVGLGGGDAGEMLRHQQQVDIDAQKSDYEAALRGTEGRRSALTQLAQLYGSPEAAETALRQRQLAVVKQRAEAAMARAGSDVGRERLGVFAAQVGEQLAQLRARLEEQTLATIQSSIAYDPGGYRGGRAPDLAGATATAKQLGELTQVPADAQVEPLMVHVDGAPVGVAKTQRAKDQYEVHQQILGSVADFEDTMQRWRVAGLNPVQRREAESARQTLVHDYAQLLISRGIEGSVAIKEAEAKVPGIGPIANRESLAAVDIRGIRSESEAAVRRLEANEIVNPRTGRGIGKAPIRGARKVED